MPLPCMTVDGYTQTEPTEEYIRLTRLEGIVVSVLCAVLLVVLLFAPQ